MYELDPDLRHAKLLDESESVVYRIGEYVYKLYKWCPLRRIQQYQALTRGVNTELADQSLKYYTHSGPVVFAWHIVPILDITTVQTKAVAICPYIPGPRLSEVVKCEDVVFDSQGQAVIQAVKSELGEAIERVARSLAYRFRCAAIDLNPFNMKPLVTGENQFTLAVTDLASSVENI